MFSTNHTNRDIEFFSNVIFIVGKHQKVQTTNSIYSGGGRNLIRTGMGFDNIDLNPNTIS